MSMFHHDHRAESARDLEWLLTVLETGARAIDTKKSGYAEGLADGLLRAAGLVQEMIFADHSDGSQCDHCHHEVDHYAWCPKQHNDGTGGASDG